MEFYCMKCRKKVKGVGEPRPIVLRNGRAALESVCEHCGTRLVRILKKK